MPQPAERPLLFIVSTGRTGTQFLARALEVLGADARHEPGPRWLRLESNAYVSGSLSAIKARGLLRAARRTIAVPRRPVYAEASCLVWGLVRPILDTYPTANVVHVVRDPRTYVRSAVNWGVHRLSGRPLNAVPFRRLAPPQFHPLDLRLRVRWFLQGQFKRICWTWACKNREMRQQGQGEARFRTIRFEEVFDAGRGFPGLFEIATIAGLSPTPTLISEIGRKRQNPAKRSDFPTWPNWTPSQLAYFQETCGSEAAQYGYDLSP